VALVERQATASVRRAAVLEAGAPTELKRDSWVYGISKRVLDVILSIIAVTLTSPLMLVIAAAIKLESRGPVLFGHIRLTRGGKRFPCYKFRSMGQEAQRELQSDPELWSVYVENDYKIPLEVDPRITRVGRFLRKTSLDELPQLFNVIAGSMSLVGPRPIVPEELHWYGEHKEEFLSVRPGITGPWQVQGRSRIPYPNRTMVELEGIRGRSLRRDVKVLAQSIPAVIKARGAL
jgi:lipopolysaccharide/colanic/teichoic acid biosynthesis glycosyltransferase